MISSAKHLSGVIWLMLMTFASLSYAEPSAAANKAALSTKQSNQQQQVIIETNYGNMRFQLFPEAAPLSVSNFIGLIHSNWYQDKTFYRVVKGHVIQAGSGDDNDQPLVKAEFNQHPHIRGALGLARGDDPDSGSTEFYICHQARPHLDGNYTVFGQMIEGFDTLDKIANAEVTESWWGDDNDVAFHSPNKPVVIKTIRLINKATNP